ncbi:hypothetical protein HN832_02935 [archaeon]|jgi:glycerophosphoryl diester phosphodiesterase|nr:hypothetical protein [archaeon]MBT4373311.1 hypothetical protein [archaeon]MBT4531656.1 hypothetical protein [archaeon]MBT7001166.1 hypothetical protein [archaeon]MBT7282348.1 hypothetical protein [archaeon]
MNKSLRKFMFLKTIATVFLLANLVLSTPAISEVSANVVYGAHRGASLEHKENTLDAFEEALDNSKYKFIEFDVTYTKDGEKVVIHQNNIFRRPKNGAVVRDLTYEELQEKFEFHIPTYEEVMDLIAGGKPLDIEIKTTGDVEKDNELVESIIEDCEARGILNQIMISSISEDVVNYIEEKYPEIKTGKIYWVTLTSLLPWENICEEVYDTPADYVLLHGHNVHNFEILMECKPEDKTLMIWYFTDEVYIIQDKAGCNFWESC